MTTRRQGNESGGDVKAAPAALALACGKMKAAGMRLTRPRLAILAALIKRGEPASIEQIHAEIGASRCDLVTVYRGMAAFEEIGLIRRSFFPNGTGLYAITQGEAARYYVVCKRSRRMAEIDPEAGAELRKALHAVEEKLRARGYMEIGHSVEFSGIAPGISSRPASNQRLGDKPFHLGGGDSRAIT